MSDIKISIYRERATIIELTPLARSWVTHNIDTKRRPVVVDREHIEDLIIKMKADNLEVEE